MAHSQQVHPPKKHRNQTWMLSIDLGSTLSASAFCLTSDTTDNCIAGEVRTVQGYKAANRNRSDTLRHREVPTKVRYEAGGNIRYGWDAARLVEKGLDRNLPGVMVDLFKPGLDDKNETRDERRHIDDLLVRLQSEMSLTKTVDNVVTDFLVKLLGHVKDQLEPRGHQDGDLIQLICTVPAMWSIRSRRRTIKAAKEAAQICQFRLDDNITVLSEPEAATAYVQRKNDLSHFKRGDTFIVCDAGGVTVDAITYMVHSVEPLLLKQVVRSKGSFCGSSFLNKRFESHIRKRLEDAERRTGERMHSPRLEEDIKNALLLFELELKRDHGDESDDSLSGVAMVGLEGELPQQWITVQGVKSDPENGLREDGMAITRSNLNTVFQPILERCWALIHAQLHGAYEKFHQPTRILIVGGFGDSPLLRSFVKTECSKWIQEIHNGHKRLPINIVVPETPGSAIAEGAIYRALQEGIVKDYISRSSICICSHDPYNPRQKAHEGASFVHDEFENRNYVPDCVKILLRTDQMIPSSGIRKLTALHRTISVDDKAFFLTLDIYEMEDENGLDDFPLSHSKNKGYQKLETVEFEVNVEPIKDKLKLTLLGSSTHVDQTTLPQNAVVPVTDDESTLRRGKRYRKASSKLLTSRGLDSANEDATQPGTGGSYYYWIDYRVEVEFKDSLLSYQLLIDGVDDYSYRGSVTLGPSIEVWKE